MTRVNLAEKLAQFTSHWDPHVVPKGATHRPRAKAECTVLLIEPKGVPNTGDPATAASKPRI